MAHSTRPTVTADRARETCLQARQLARLQGRRRAWATVVTAVDPVTDPCDLLRQHPRADLLWQCDAHWLVSLGCAGTWRSFGPDRHAAIARRSTALALRMAVSCDDPAHAPAMPLLLLRSAFADDPTDGSVWGVHGGGSELLLPRLTWWRLGDRCWRIACCEVAAEADDTTIDQLAASLATAPADPVDETPAQPWPALALPDYRHLVGAARLLLRDGALRKVVICRAEDIDLPRPVDRAALVDILRRRADGLSWCYSLALDGHRHFSGLTPEALLSCREDRWQSWALAGSRRRSLDPDADQQLADELLGSTKERKEHQLVVEHLLTHLGPRSSESHAPDHPSLRRLTRIQHLETPLHGRFRDDDHLSLLDDLHPTPAVGGLPMPLAGDWISHHEGLDRGLYSGLIGYHSPGHCHLAVALRGALIDDHRARLFAGAGIVERSEPEAEFQETMIKMLPIRSALEECAGGDGSAS